MQKGDFYEEKAVDFLKLKGYRILERNFSTRWGEIDIIAKDRRFICFIEVKARNLNHLVGGLEAVDSFKQKRIIKTARIYLSKIKENYFRFDVLEIIEGENWREYNLVRSAFEDEKL
jgi:putative endonuclease